MTEGWLGRISVEGIVQAAPEARLARMSAEVVVQESGSFVDALLARMSTETVIQHTTPEARLARISNEVVVQLPHYAQIAKQTAQVAYTLPEADLATQIAKQTAQVAYYLNTDEISVSVSKITTQVAYRNRSHYIGIGG